MRSPLSPGWRWTAAWYRLLGVSVLTVGLAVGVGRADLIVLGAPFVLLVVLGRLTGRPAAASELTATASLTAPLGQRRPAGVRVGLTGTAGAQWATVSLPAPDGRPVGRLLAIQAPDAGSGDLVTETGPLTWGKVLISRPDVVAVGVDGLSRMTPVESTVLAGTVVPDVPQVDGLALPPILGGWSGEHASRRPGQGNELIDLREYLPGDRLRSIHWRAYARHQKLYVRRTESSADAEFVLCLDTRHDIGPERNIPRSRTFVGRQARAASGWLEVVSRWTRTVLARPGNPAEQPSSSLDLLVAATAGIAATQLKLGDRIGVLDLAAPARHLRLGTGTRHLQRIREQLSTLGPSNTAFALRPDQWRLPSAAVVVLVSALADDEAVRAALEVRARGHQVQVVDVLPVNALRAASARRFPGPGERIAREGRIAALEVALAERELRLDRLRAAGIPILRWEDGQIGTDIRLARRAGQARR